MNETVSVHAEAFADLDHDSTMGEAAAFAVTEGGKRAVREILSRPLHSAEVLRARAGDVTGMKTEHARIRDVLEAIRDDEAGATWCAMSPDELDADTAEAVESPYFKGWFAKPLNSWWPAIWANNCYSIFAVPLLALSAPLSYLLAPYFIIRFKLKLPLDFRTFVRLMYHSFKGAGAALKIAFGTAPSFAMQLASVVMTCVMYFQAVVSSVRHSVKLVAAITRVCRNVNSMHRVLKTCETVADGYDDAFYSRWCRGYRAPGPGAGSTETYAEAIRPWRTSYSRALTEYASLDREWIRRRLAQLYHLDAVCALHMTAARHRMSRVHFVKNDALLIRQGRRLRADDAPNDVAAMRGINGIVLTGPNASGKSTLLRMVGCVVLLSQTLGLAPARSCALTPIKYLTTMMGIRDDPKAGRSRFQNELQRAGECVESARSMPDDVGLLLMDEIFGGTDPSQGDACGGKVLTSMAETARCIYILATHQRGLVQHSETLPSARRYRMDSGYRLVAGVNESFNAADLYDKKFAA